MFEGFSTYLGYLFLAKYRGDKFADLPAGRNCWTKFGRQTESAGPICWVAASLPQVPAGYSTLATKKALGVAHAALFVFGLSQALMILQDTAARLAYSALVWWKLPI
jgi:hypothetical protein